MKDVLVNHYEEKYKSEISIKLRAIPYTKYSRHRDEACIKYFVDHFKGGSVLEMAAGNGTLAYSLLKSHSGIEKYMATDLSQNRLTAIKNNITDSRIHVAHLDVEHFNPDEYEKFDAIIMVALIEHLIDPISAMIQIKKLLKPGGIVYIDTPNIADYGSRFKLMRGIFPSTASKNEGLTTYNNERVTLYDEGHLHYFTHRALKLMLLDYCGFQHVKYHAYLLGKLYFGKWFHLMLARVRPQLFSPLVVIAS